LLLLVPVILTVSVTVGVTVRIAITLRVIKGIAITTEIRTRMSVEIVLKPEKCIPSRK
jgi:hypothetical protein